MNRVFISVGISLVTLGFFSLQSLHAQGSFSPMVEIIPDSLPPGYLSPPTPQPKPSLWNWELLLPPGPQQPLKCVYPNITQELYQDTAINSSPVVEKVATTRWGIESCSGELSAFASKGDGILSIDGGDLILTNLTPGLPIRFGTTSPGATGGKASDQERVTITGDGRVGIMNNTPRELLELGDRFTFHSGGVKFIGYNFWYDASAGTASRISAGAASRIALDPSGTISLESYPANATLSSFPEGNHLEVGTNYARIWTYDDGELFKIIGDTNNFQGAAYFKNKVYIGTHDPGITPSNDIYMLAVNGSVKAKEIIVDCQDWANWPDYVFNESYELMPLADVEKYVKREKHLPGIPSAHDVSSNGIAVGDMQAKLLQKIEELTLYVIDLEKDNERMKEKIENLEKNIADIRE